MEIENPMLLGEYPGAPLPDRIARCARCGRIYRGFCTDGGIQWDSGDDSFVLTPARGPVKDGKCVACAWERRTPQDELAYVREEVPAQRLLAYALCGDERVFLRDEDCEVMLQAMLAAQSAYARELIGDYVADCRRDDFVAWSMGRRAK